MSSVCSRSPMGVPLRSHQRRRMRFTGGIFGSKNGLNGALYIINEADGSLGWTIRPSDIEINGVAQDTTINFQVHEDAVYLLTAKSSGDMGLSKISYTGEILWRVEVITDEVNLSTRNSMAVKPDGKVILGATDATDFSGYPARWLVYSPIDGSKVGSTINPANGASFDDFIVAASDTEVYTATQQYDITGSPLDFEDSSLPSHYGGGFETYDSSGNIYASGSPDFSSDYACLWKISSAGSITASIDFNGGSSGSYADGNDHASGLAVALASDGSVYLLTTQDDDIESGQNLFKLTSGLSKSWGVEIDYSGGTAFRGLSATTDGGVVVITSNGYSKYDSSGNLLWSRNSSDANTPGLDLVRGVPDHF